MTPAQRAAAKTAALAWLLSDAIAILSYYILRPRIVAAGDAAQTANNILAHEQTFRLMILGDIVYAIGAVILVVALYLVLEPAGRGIALVAAACRLVFALTWLLAVANLFDALRLVSLTETVRSLPADQLHALARVSLRVGTDLYYIGLPFYGLASTLCAILWFKARYIPRALAAFGVVASGWCLASGLIFIAFPGFGTAVNLYSLDSPMTAFEIITSFWMLLRPLRG